MPLVSLNGFEMYYEVRGEGEALLLLHGGTGIGNDWRQIFAADLDGYRVIVPDLRGHGRSTNPAKRFTFRQCARGRSTINSRNTVAMRDSAIDALDCTEWRPWTCVRFDGADVYCGRAGASRRCDVDFSLDRVLIGAAFERANAALLRSGNEFKKFPRRRAEIHGSRFLQCLRNV